MFRSWSDADFNIIAGHGRLLACQHLGWTEVPTIRIDHLTEAQRRAFMIADNRLTEIAVWDDHLLADQLKELSSVDLDFDIEATGFDMGEIDLRIESLSEADRGPVEPPLPTALGPAVTQKGDLWLLGRHRLLCANAVDASSYQRLMATEKSAAVFTDPPYNVPIDGHVSGLGQMFPRKGPAPYGALQFSWQPGLCLHGLAAYGGAARRRSGECSRDAQSLHLDEAQCRDGELLPVAT
ncbi:MAG: ParB/Srx family N-terminal domain-containing protein [Methylocella sp.]